MSGERDDSMAFPMMSMGGVHEHQFFQVGLTKRELFAAMAMQAMLRQTYMPSKVGGEAEDAVAAADRLIAALSDLQQRGNSE